MKIITLTRTALCAAALWMTAGAAHAADAKLMHCFAWTSIKEATEADWQAFFKASDAIPSKIKGVTRVWYGKLASPLGQTSIVEMDKDTTAKYRAGEPVTAKVQRTPRDWGMCMEMNGAAAREAYAKNPYHEIWTAAYAKIRVDGTTTFDFLQH